MNPLVSVIILNYNGEQFIEEGLTSIVYSDYDNLEIILVDNMSTDKSVKKIRDKFNQIRIIENHENLGFAEGNNVGIREAHGTYICLLNNDVKVDASWVNPLVNFLEKNRAFAAVQPKILSWQNPGQFEYAGAAGNYIDRLGIPFSRGRILNQVEEDRGQYDDAVEIFWASGAAICFRKEVIEKIGELDKDFFLHQEEIDFCWRILLNGWKIAVIPESKIYHYGGASLNYESPQKLYLNYRNNLTMIIKNLGCKRMCSIIPMRLMQDLAAAGLKLVKGEFLHSLAVARGYLSVLIHIVSIIKKRSFVQKKIRRVTDDELDHLIYKNSIVLDSFMKGRKRFQEIGFIPSAIKKSS